MQLPRLKDFPAEVPHKEVGREMEAMVAGLECDPPDSFVDDWQESMEEAKRLLAEVEGEPSG